MFLSNSIQSYFAVNSIKHRATHLIRKAFKEVYLSKYRLLRCNIYDTIIGHTQKYDSWLNVKSKIRAVVWSTDRGGPLEPPLHPFDWEIQNKEDQ